MSSSRLSRHVQPRLVAERKPVRPVRVASVRTPIAVTKPITLGGQHFVATRLAGPKNG